MIIRVLDQKYKIGCNKGISSVQETNILEKLNKIIEWDFVRWPEQVDKEGNTTIKNDFLGIPPELKPGNVFYFDSSVFAIDSPDKLVCILTETGPKTIKRVVEETILPEYDCFNYSDNTKILSHEIIKNDTTIRTKKEYISSWKYSKQLRDKIIFGRFDLDINDWLKVNINCDELIDEAEVWISHMGSVYVNPVTSEFIVKEKFIQSLIKALNNKWTRAKYVDELEEKQRKEKESRDEIIKMLQEQISSELKKK